MHRHPFGTRIISANAQKSIWNTYNTRKCTESSQPASQPANPASQRIPPGLSPRHLSKNNTISFIKLSQIHNFLVRSSLAPFWPSTDTSPNQPDKHGARGAAKRTSLSMVAETKASGDEAEAAPPPGGRGAPEWVDNPPRTRLTDNLWLPTNDAGYGHPHPSSSRPYTKPFVVI